MKNILPKIILGILIFFILLHLSNATDFNKLANLAGQRYGISARDTILSLQRTVDQLKSASDLEKVNRINDFFNAEIKYFDEDINTWG